VRTACAEILASARAYAPQARIIGVSVQEMVGEGVEVIIGVTCDPQLGPVLLFGSGGVMVEVYNDVALRRCPITRSEAQAMIAEVKGARLLQGFRGRPAADLEALADTLVRVSHLAMHMEGHLAELDINPLMVLPRGQGVKAVDALVVFSRHIAPRAANYKSLTQKSARPNRRQQRPARNRQPPLSLGGRNCS